MRHLCHTCHRVSLQEVIARIMIPLRAPPTGGQLSSDLASGNGLNPLSMICKDVCHYQNGFNVSSNSNVNINLLEVARAGHKFHEVMAHDM